MQSISAFGTILLLDRLCLLMFVLVKYAAISLLILSGLAFQWRHVSLVMPQIADNTRCSFNSLLRITAKRFEAPHYCFCEKSPPITGGFPSRRLIIQESEHVPWHHSELLYMTPQFHWRGILPLLSPSAVHDWNTLTTPGSKLLWNEINRDVKCNVEVGRISISYMLIKETKINRYLEEYRYGSTFSVSEFTMM